MKKRVLSALLALCLTLSLAGAAFAENEPPVTTASPAPVTQNLDENNGEPAELNENGEDLDNTEPTGETLDDATDGAQDSDSTGVPEEGNTSDEDNSTSTDEGDSTPAVDSSSEDDSTGTEDENASTPSEEDTEGTDASEADQNEDAVSGPATSSSNEIQKAPQGVMPMSNDVDTLANYDSLDCVELKWGNNKSTLKAYLVNVNKNGTQVTSSLDDAVDISDTKGNIDAIAKALRVDSEKFEFGWAILKNSADEAADAKNEGHLTGLKYDKSWQYTTGKYLHVWKDVSKNGGKLYFVFKEKETGGGSGEGGNTLTTTLGLDTKNLININVFDYETLDYATEWNPYFGINSGINSGHSLKFYGDTGVENDGQEKVNYDGSDPINEWTNNDSYNNGYIAYGGGVYQGIVNNTLTGGYPTLATHGGESLAYLFDLNTLSDNSKRQYKWVYDNANHLFTKDSEGYYTYDSSENFATLRKVNSEQSKTENDFALYSVPRSQNNGDSKVPSDHAQFLPFNALTGVLTDAAYTDYALVGGSENADHHFGMTVEFNFNMLDGGTVNGKPMIFSFSGDDDVWVFIDDVLVLDMGGIHNNYQGTIDFSTGNVEIERVWKSDTHDNERQYTSTLEALFEAAGKTWNGEDLSTHTLKFFYLERGAGGSNCQLRFNIQPLPASDLMISKTANEYAPANQEYTFVLKDSSGNPVTNKTYSVYEGSTTGDPMSNSNTTGQTGTITLEANQIAVFKDFYSETNGNIHSTYTVTEQTSGLSHLDSVVLSGGTSQDTQNHQITVVYRHSSISFRNVFNPSQATLTITKIFQGLDAGSIAAAKNGVSFQISNYDGEIAFEDPELDDNGNYTMTATVTGLLYGNEYTVTETCTAPEGYAVESYVGEGTENNGKAATFTAGVSNAVTFTNVYVAPEEPQHQKYIKDNGGGTYNLTLNVTGSAQEQMGEKTKIDLIYVLDFSYSMQAKIDETNVDENWTKGNYGRYRAIKEAVDALNKELSDERFDVRIATVKFWGSSKIESNDGDWWMTIDQFDENSVLPALTQDYESDWDPAKIGLGPKTNYADALKDANLILDSDTDEDRSDAKKVVVFVSDGEPNAGGSRDPYVTDLQAGINAASNIAADYFYAIGVGGDVDNMNGIANAAVSCANHEFFTSSNSTALVEKFSSMAADFTSINCSNITITDELSNYAELTDSATFTVKAVNGSKTATAVVTKEEASAANGKSGTLTYSDSDPDGEKLNASFTVKYDDKTKTITLTLPGALENGWVYSITTTVQPTDQARKEYAANIADGNDGYGDVKGDLETDAPGNDTSSNKPGFHTNNRATLIYTYNKGDISVDGTATYAHPVLQVPTTSLTIMKNFKNEDETVLSDEKIKEILPITFTLKADGYQDQTVDLNTSNYQNGATVSNLPVGVTYTIVENQSDAVWEGHSLVVSVDEDHKTDTEGKAQITVKSVASNTVTFTNTYTPNEVTLTINKQICGLMGDTTSTTPFSFTLQLQDTPIGTSVNKGRLTYQINGGQDQSVTYTDASNGYTIQIQANQTATIKVPYGVYVSITETEQDGYEAYWRVGDAPSSAPANPNNNSSEGLKNQGFTDGNIVPAAQLYMTSEQHVYFMNFRDVVAPTGLEDNHTKPFGLMVGVAVMAGLALAGGAVVRRRRRWME